MKTLVKSALCLAVGLLMAASANAQDKKVDPTGKWTWSFEGRNGNTFTSTLMLKMEGDKLTGTVMGRGGRGRRGGNGGGNGGGNAAGQRQRAGTPIEDAKLKGDEISFTVTREFNGNKFVSKYTAKITGDTMKGKISSERNGQTRERDFEAKRETEKK